MLRLVIHAGTGSPAEWKDGTDNALKAALEKVDEGGSALDAVIAAVMVMEDDERFNAGTGSRIRIDGSIQMDAAVMVPGGFGGVACIERVKHPILVARAVMERTPHILLCDRGATEFAKKCGFPEYNPCTEKAVKRYKETLARARMGEFKEKWQNAEFWKEYLEGCDTVGAVCCLDGDKAAALSTGGAGMMLPGRIGDTPAIACGIYVDNDAAVVATGVGEDIMKHVVAFKVHQRIPSLGAQKACESILKEFPQGVPVGVVATTRDDIGCAASTKMAYSMCERD